MIRKTKYYLISNTSTDYAFARHRTATTFDLEPRLAIYLTGLDVSLGGVRRNEYWT